MRYTFYAVLFAVTHVMAQEAETNAKDSVNQTHFSFSSRWSIGLEGGYNQNYLLTNVSSLAFTQYKPLSGIMIGVPVEFSFNEWLSLYSDPQFVQKRYKYERTNFFQGVYEDYRNSYVQLPLMAKFSFGGKKLRGYFSGGVYGGYWVSSRIKGTIPNPGDLNMSYDGTNPTSVFDELNPYSFNEKYSFNNQTDNRWEFGWAAALGIKYDVTNSIQVFVEGRTMQSLTGHQKHYMTSQVPQYNQTYMATAGCLVKLNSLMKSLNK